MEYFSPAIMEYIPSILFWTVLMCVSGSVRAHAYALLSGCLGLIFIFWNIQLIFLEFSVILVFVLCIPEFFIIYLYQLWLLLWNHDDNPLFNAYPEVQLVESFLALTLVFFLLARCVQVIRILLPLGDWKGLIVPIADVCIKLLQCWWQKDDGLPPWQDIIMRNESSVWHNGLKTTWKDRRASQRVSIKVDRVLGTPPPEQDWDPPIGFSPREFEYEPNPVIFSHLRRGSPTSTHMNTGWQEHNEAWFNPEERQPQISSRDTHPGYEGPLHSASSSRSRNNPESDPNPALSPLYLPAPTHGPASSVPVLSVYACPQCPETFRKAHERNKHLNRKHLRRYQCPTQGCSKKFGLNGSLERHIRSCHNPAAEIDGLRCPNLHCKSPENVFARRDNLERHVRRCKIAVEK